MVKSKPSHQPKGNESKNLIDGNKGQTYKLKKCRGKKPRNKPSPEHEYKTHFKGQCNDL